MTLARWLSRLMPRPFDSTGSSRPVTWRQSMSSTFREAPLEALPGFVAAGYKQRHFFPHRFYYLPKCGPDGFKLARWMGANNDLRQHWQIVLFASGPSVDRFPDELFFDNRLNWHQQHFYRRGQIAWVNLFVKGSTLFTTAHQSDLVQRVPLRREFKTQVETAFKGWHRLLLNCVGNFALERGIRRIRVPVSSFAMKHTDRQRVVQPELFERVYDRAINHQFTARRLENWWAVDVAANRSAIVKVERRSEETEPKKVICLCHDVERGLGHRNSNPQFAGQADREAPSALDRMLEIERKFAVRATYNVVGLFLEEVRERIENDGHCIAFHSYNHELNEEQLRACRRVDYRLKGYRAPQSLVTRELRETELCWHNFEWLASSSFSLGFSEPRLERGVVKVPILFDDFDLYRGRTSFESWQRQALDTIAKNEFVAFCLHDCYAEFWLPHYETFLHQIQKFGRLSTVDEVAADVFLAGAA